MIDFFFSFIFTGFTLRRIRAVRDFGGVKAGDLGGWIQHEGNLFHDGACWVSGEARVFGEAQVYGEAKPPKKKKKRAWWKFF